MGFDYFEQHPKRGSGKTIRMLEEAISVAERDECLVQIAVTSANHADRLCSMLLDLCPTAKRQFSRMFAVGRGTISFVVLDKRGLDSKLSTRSSLADKEKLLADHHTLETFYGHIIEEWDRFANPNKDKR